MLECRGHARKSCAQLQVSSFTEIPSYFSHLSDHLKEASCGVLIQQMVVGLTPASECESAYVVCVCASVCVRVRTRALSPLAQLSADHCGIFITPAVTADRPPHSSQIDLNPAVELGATSLQTDRTWHGEETQMSRM